MAIAKLILVSAGLLVFVLGGLYLALVLGRNKKTDSRSCNTTDTSDELTFGCGCGTGACGLPTERKV